MNEEYDNSKGGEQGYKGGGPGIPYDDFVQRIVQNPNDPPKVTLLSGFLGSSSEEGHVRLYLDEELSRYVEIPEKAIRHIQKLLPEQSPLGGSLVWIDSGAEVVHGAAGAERRKATFLQGQIEQDYIGGAGGFGLAGGGIGNLTTQTRECRMGGGMMPADIGSGCGQMQSNMSLPPSVVQTCHTKTGIVCTRIGPNCRRTSSEEPAFAGTTLHGGDCVTQTTGCHEMPTRVPMNCYVGGGGEAFAAQQTQFCVSRVYRCASVVDACPTRICPSHSTPCQSQLVRCPSALDACPTRFGCFETAVCGGF